jgi:alpha-beta hydrolase superfamily lysophospholipase
VLIVHGLGEHASRYTHVARQLLEWGFAVRAYDQRGHGESGGGQGRIGSERILLEDLAEVVDDTRLRCMRLPNADPKKPLPLILLGHSLGGLVVGNFVARKVRKIEGLVMSSPALDPGLSPMQKILLAVTPALLPNLCVDNGLNPKYLSHDREVVRRYTSDPLVHRRISARLAKFIATAGPATIEAAARWEIPTLLMYAGADRIVRPEGSRAFAQAYAKSSNAKPGTVTTRNFEGFYHEIFNEVGSNAVFDCFRTWLDARF